MTIAEVLSELKATTTSFEWRLVGSAKLLQGFLRSGEPPVPFDPIRALAFIKTGRIFEQASTLHAGGAIGLLPRDCSDIVDACNNSIKDTAESIEDPYKAWLRRQLIFAVALNFSSRPNAVWKYMPGA